MSDFIARYNPYQMEEETILALATGRDASLQETIYTLKENLGRTGIHQHLMVYGPRGMGKSFFLKYLNIKFSRDKTFNHARFILFPEEQSNIRFASDFVRMVLSQVEETGFQSVTPFWREPEGVWQQYYSRLEHWCKERKEENPDFMLVVVLENFHEFMETLSADTTGLHRFRHILEHLPAFTFIGASPMQHIDGDYNNPIFHIFKEIRLRDWNGQDFLDYLSRRRARSTKHTEQKWTNDEMQLMDAQIKAISPYLGGSPRMATVLCDILLKNKGTAASQALWGLVDELTPFYQELVKEMRKRPNSLALFDALVRMNENLSQSELAEKIGAKQSDISKAFAWLHQNGFIDGKKRTGSREFRYFVKDRMFAFYYRQRELYQQNAPATMQLLTDFLAVFYQEEKNAKENGIFKRWDGLVVEKEQKEGTAAAFLTANTLLHQLHEETDQNKTAQCLSTSFAGLLKSPLSQSLLQSLTEECRYVFHDSVVCKCIAEATECCSRYTEAKQNNSGSTFLENLHPDMAIAVRAMVT